MTVSHVVSAALNHAGLALIGLARTYNTIITEIIAVARENHQFGFPTRSDTNRAVQSQKQAGSL